MVEKPAEALPSVNTPTSPPRRLVDQCVLESLVVSFSDVVVLDRANR